MSCHSRATNGDIASTSLVVRLFGRPVQLRMPNWTTTFVNYSYFKCVVTMYRRGVRPSHEEDVFPSWAGSFQIMGGFVIALMIVLRGTVGRQLPTVRLYIKSASGGGVAALEPLH